MDKTLPRCLERPSIFRLKPESKLFLIGLFTVASYTDNKIPDDPEWLAEELRLPIKLIDFSPLIASGFLTEEHDASEVLAERQQVASDLMPSCSVSYSFSVSNSVSESSEAWPDEDLWIRTFIETQQRAFNGTHVPYLISYRYWNDLSEAVNGLSLQFLNTEFAKMALWLRDNPQKGPTPKGVRRFVATWLQKGAERERKAVPTAPRSYGR